MTEDEIGQLLVDLENLLIELGLGFVVAQERVLAVEGVSRSPAEADTRGTERPRGSARRTAFQFKNSDVVVTPLDVRARLSVLLDLTEVATAGTLVMERDIRDQIDDLRLSMANTSTTSAKEPTPAAVGYADWAEMWNGTILFSDPPEAELRGQQREPWRLADAGAFATKALQALAVVELLDELRLRAGLSRGQWLLPHGEDSDTGWNLVRRQHGERG